MVSFSSHLEWSLACILFGYRSSALAQDPAPDPDLVALGRAMFFDENLSANGTQSCAACHASEVGFTGPDAAVNAGGAVYPGALPNRFGNRKPPAAAYAGDSPLLHFDAAEGAGSVACSGMGEPRAQFWEIHWLSKPRDLSLTRSSRQSPDAHAVCVEVASAAYADFFEEVWGAGIARLRRGCDGRIRADWTIDCSLRKKPRS